MERSFQRMLALCMEDNIDEKRMQESLQVLNKMKELGDGFNYINERMQPDYSYVNDIYETIDEFSKFENSIGIKYGCRKEFVKAKLNDDREILLLSPINSFMCCFISLSFWILE